MKHILAADISGIIFDIGRSSAKEAGIENVTFQQATVGSFDAGPPSFDDVLVLLA